MIVIDFTQKTLNESFLTTFGYGAKEILSRLLGGDVGLNNIRIRGTRSDIGAFAKALQKEENYMRQLRATGLGDPSVLDTKYKLEKAVKEFEASTGLIWPFK